MRANTTESNLLIFAVDFFHKGFMRKGAIVGVIMFHMPICLSKNFLKCFDGKSSLVDGEVAH